MGDNAEQTCGYIHKYGAHTHECPIGRLRREQALVAAAKSGSAQRLVKALAAYQVDFEKEDSGD